MRLTLYILASVAAFGQAQTPFKVPQNSGSVGGAVWLQEPRASGTNWLKLKAGAMANDIELTAPTTTGTAGQCLQTDGTGVMSWASCGAGYATVSPSEYDWSQTITAPGAAGTHTITLTPGPLGVSAADTVSQYWLSGTAGADEYVTSTGTGTCDGTALSSCTIEVVTANSHTGTTTLRSASAGAQEAINAGPTSITLLYGNEAVTWRACVAMNSHNVAIVGQGRGSSITLATPSQRGVCKLTAGYLEMRNISIIGDGTTTGIYAQASVSNAGSDRIDNCFFQNHAKAINHRVISETWITRNLFYSNTVDLETVNEVNNDQGALIVSENNFLSDGTSSSKSIWFHGPGGSWFHKNAFTGARDSFYADGVMATVNTSGTAVTATEGRFYSGMAGGSYYINGTTYTIAAYVDSTHITLASSAGTQTGVAFGQSTGQFHFEDNNFDNQNRSGVWFDGAIYFGGVNLRGNTFSNFFGSEQYIGIKITNPAIDAVMIADNKFGNLAGVTYDHTGIYASYSGTNLSITGNTFLAQKYSINLDFGGTTNATDTLISGNTFKGGSEAGTIGIRMRNVLRATVAANNIYNYITGVDIAGASSAEIAIVGGKITCPASGTGIAIDAATSVAVNAVDFGTACTTMTALSGGATVTTNATTGTATNRYTASGSSTIRDNAPESATILTTGTNDTAAIGSISRYTTGTAAANFGVQQSITLENASGSGITAGGWQFRWADATNMYPEYDLLISKNNGGLVIGASLDTNKNWISYGSLYSSIGSVTGRFGADLNSGAGIGTFSNHPLSLYTDSTARWLVSATGMFQPQVDDTYDIGLTGTRARTVYAKAGEFFKSGSTSSSDYVTTRKLNVLDQSGGSGMWDIQASGSMAATSAIKIRDNAGSRWLEAYRALAGSPLNYTSVFGHLYPAKRATGSGDAVNDSTFGNLGDTSARWANIYGDALDLSGAANITGNLSAAVINATGSPAYRVAGTTVINASRAATFTDLTINTSSAPAVGYVWTATSTGGAGSWQAAAVGLPVVDTTAIAKGSSDATKLVRLEVDGLTTSTTRVMTVPNTDLTLAGLNVTQTFVNPQTVAIASVQNQMTLAQTNSAGAYDPACLVLAATDTVGSTVYGAARLCAGYESALFTDEKFAIQTATGSGTYQDALTVKNQVVTIAGDLVASAGSFSLSSGTMTGTMKPLFGGTGKIGDSGYSYGNGYFSASGFVLTDTTTVGYVWTATSTGGAGSWQAAAASQWTTSGANIYRATGSVGIGTSAPNFQFDITDNSAGTNNLTTISAITRRTTGTAANGLGGAQVWVLEDAGGSLIATNKISSIWTDASTGARQARMDFYSATANTSTIAMSISHSGQVDFAGVVTTGGSITVTGSATANRFNATSTNPFQVSGTTIVDASRNASFANLTWSGTVSNSITFSAGSTYNVGSTGAPPLNVYGNYIEPLTELVMGSGVVFRGSLIPATNNTDAIGNTSFRVSNVATVNANISGTITAPSGAAGQSVTITVRDSAGTGTCTIIFSGGLKTGGTC